MREWQVGDPVGDGNDIGVPDIPYMGYLRDNDDKSLDEESIHKFNRSIYYAKSSFNANEIDLSFTFLFTAFGMYEEMNDFEKSQIKKDPFNQYWIIDLCCQLINRHGDDYKNALEIIKENRLRVKICRDCNCVYPTDYTCCIRCGKELTDPYQKKPEQYAGEIRAILKRRYVGKVTIEQLVNRSVKLMKSNDCRIVEIADRRYCIDFIFEKEHKYFKTTYVCEYIPGTLRIFEDFGVTHNHDKLLRNESFKKLIKDTEDRTGYTFKECDGGYGFQSDDNNYDFTFNDEINVKVRFDMGNNQTAVYDLDLDNMQLSYNYTDY